MSEFYILVFVHDDDWYFALPTPVNRKETVDCQRKESNFQWSLYHVLVPNLRVIVLFLFFDSTVSNPHPFKHLLNLIRCVDQSYRYANPQRRQTDRQTSYRCSAAPYRARLLHYTLVLAQSEFTRLLCYSWTGSEQSRDNAGTLDTGRCAVTRIRRICNHLVRRE